MPTSPRRRTLATALTMGRVLAFPVPISPLGQFELFPEPVPPDPHSPSMLIIRFTELQMRVVKIASDLSPSERERMFADYWASVELLTAYEQRIARTREVAVDAWHRLTA